MVAALAALAALAAPAAAPCKSTDDAAAGAACSNDGCPVEGPAPLIDTSTATPSTRRGCDMMPSEDGASLLSLSDEDAAVAPAADDEKSSVSRKASVSVSDIEENAPANGVASSRA